MDELRCDARQEFSRYYVWEFAIGVPYARLRLGDATRAVRSRRVRGTACRIVTKTEPVEPEHAEERARGLGAGREACQRP
jgi:hypothetical protein